MYHHLVTISPGRVELTPSIPVKKGIRQDSSYFFAPFNNTVNVPQKNVLTTCIFKDIDVLLANYADDFLGISRTAVRIVENFQIPNRQYKHIGLQFNENKTEFQAFNNNSDCPTNAQLVEHVMEVQDTLTYLGIPIGSNLHTYMSIF